MENRPTMSVEIENVLILSADIGERSAVIGW